MSKDKDTDGDAAPAGPWNDPDANAGTNVDAAATADGKAALDTEPLEPVDGTEPLEPVDGTEPFEPVDAEPPVEDLATAGPAVEEPAVEPSTEPAESAPQRKSGGRGWIVALVVVVVLIGGGILAWPYVLNRAIDWLPPAMVEAIQASSGMQARLDSVESDIAGLKQDAEQTATALTALRRDVAALPQGGGDDPRVDALSQALADLSDNMTALQGQHDALAGRVETLSTAAAGATAGGMAEAAEALQSGVAERLNAADARAEAAEARAAAAETLVQAVQSRLGTLEQRLAALEQVPARTPVDEQRAAVLALGQLRAAVDAGRPYAAALTTVQSVFADPDSLAPLRARAETGIVTLSALKSRFPDIIEAALHARPESGDFWDRTVKRLTSLVTVRRIGDVEGGETDAILARAEVRLNQSDLAGAVDELNALQGPAAAAAAPWLDDARARLEAEQALDRLQDQAIAKTAAG